MEVKLKYNPYWIQTKLLIDGTDVAADRRYAKFQRYTDGIPLQTWLDPIPDDDWLGLPAELEKLGQGGVRTIHIQFIGRKVDFDDLEAAARRQRKATTFEFEPRIVLQDEAMDRLIQESIADIRSPRFAELLRRPHLQNRSELQQKYENLEAEYARVRNTEFRIVFAGLYSSGKSTLINALARKQLLPTADGTCTAKVFRIEHKRGVAVAEMCCTADHGKKEVVPRRAFDSENELLEELQDLFPKMSPKEPPANPKGIDEVHIWTDLSHLYPEGFEDKFKLVLADTPGTDSGIGNQAGHHDIATQAITSADKEMVVLTVSAGNEQNDSIADLLNEIDQALDGKHRAYDQRFLFILNKCDNTSLANQESIDSKIGAYRKYISESRPALMSPRVFPISAQAALAVYSGVVDDAHITDQETQNLFDVYDSLRRKCARKFGRENYLLEQYAAAPDSVQASLSKALEQAEADEREPEIVLIHSGLPSLERTIQSYIARYAYPLKVQALLRTFYSIFTEITEWNSALSETFRQTEQLWGDAEQQKKGQEHEREVKDAQQKRLENVKRILDKCKENIGEISFDGDAQIIQLQSEIDQKIFTPVWKKLTLTGQRKQITFENREKANQYVKDLRVIFDQGTQSINGKLDEISKEIVQKVNAILQTGENALKELWDSGALEMDGFDYTQTVAFAEIKTNLQIAVNEEKGTRKNPLKDEKFKPWQIFKLIEQFFAPEEISQKDFTVDVAPIQQEVDALQRRIQQSWDHLSEECKKYIDSRKEDAAGRISEVQSSLSEVVTALNETKARIRELENDQAKYEQERKRLDEDIQFLKTIQNKLKNCVPLI